MNREQVLKVVLQLPVSIQADFGTFSLSFAVEWNVFPRIQPQDNNLSSILLLH